MIFISLILMVYYEVQYIFFNLFSVPFSFSTIGLAEQALDFTTIIKDAIQGHLPIFLLILLPFILLLIFNKKFDTTHNNKHISIALIVMFIISYLSTFVFISFNNEREEVTPKTLYYKIDDPVAIINKFGLLTYTKIDIKRQLIGYEPEVIIESEKPQEFTEEEQEIIKVYGLNSLNLDFETSSNQTTATINAYMAGTTPSKKSEYTGMFAGKNLIFILAEGFNEIAVDETRTPTLYNMIHTGFNFTNFYSPVFLSTTGGEFQATTGLIPTQETLGLWKSKKPYIAYGLGNAFGNIGYRVQSYHDWTYTYYKRDVTMKTLGFNNYMGCGNGLEKRMGCGWLPLDSDLARVTTPDYLGKEGNFVTYYVSVSGHSPYNNYDNIARLHMDTVTGNYSTSVKCYLASQVELDKMLEQLVADLTASGELDNTVIALVGDHYPYTLSTDEVNEAATYTKDGIIEINRSNFILWNSAMEEPIVIDKVGSQTDVLPTLLNLFGVEYDSRLIIGKDILSDDEGLAIFSNRSWVSDYGHYYANQRKFVPKEGKVLEGETEEEYVKRMNNRVNNAFSISKMLIDSNYYSYILRKE
jgi:phosphoglycerol transferase MdoB-like AlkP superfamily enzyme